MPWILSDPLPYGRMTRAAEPDCEVCSQPESMCMCEED